MGTTRGNGATCWLDPEDRAGIVSVLDHLGWPPAGASLDDWSRAGEGNMNLVLRVRATDGSTAILKQSRPWVERFPHISAPPERIRFEIAFYRSLPADSPVAAGMPRLLADSISDHALLLSDLGPGSDCQDWYTDPTSATPAVITALGRWLSALHALPCHEPASPLLANRAMRALNHAHVFELPFGADPVIDLDAVLPGLAALRAPFLVPEVRARIRATGQRYLADPLATDRRLHGDYFPGAWLRTGTAATPSVIDPEFGFVGPAEFDLGVAIAHLHICGLGADAVEAFQRGYGSSAEDLDPGLMRRFCGIEIARRLLGVAQLPLPANLTRRRFLLDLALELISA